MNVAMSGFICLFRHSPWQAGSCEAPSADLALKVMLSMTGSCPCSSIVAPQKQHLYVGGNTSSH